MGFHAANQSLAEEVAIPGFVPGDTQPDTNPPAVRYKDGWLVPYEETIPGSDVTFQMVPVPLTTSSNLYCHTNFPVSAFSFFKW